MDKKVMEARDRLWAWNDLFEFADYPQDCIDYGYLFVSTEGSLVAT